MNMKLNKRDYHFFKRLERKTKEEFKERIK
jgi:hypothetical protein